MILALFSILFLLLCSQTVSRNWQDHISLWSGETGCCDTRPVSNIDENVFSTKAPQKDQAYISRFNLNEHYILIPYIWKIQPLTLYCVSNIKDLKLVLHLIWWGRYSTVNELIWRDSVGAIIIWNHLYEVYGHDFGPFWSMILLGKIKTQRDKIRLSMILFLKIHVVRAISQDKF